MSREERAVLRAVLPVVRVYVHAACARLADQLCKVTGRRVVCVRDMCACA